MGDMRARDELGAVGADVVGVLAFVVVGRRSHDEGSIVLGALETAWPFLVGTAAGWAVLMALRAAGRRWAGRSLPAGAVVVAATLVVGMVLRRASGGGGTPGSFVVVAALALTVFLVGWRAALLAARRGREADV